MRRSEQLMQEANRLEEARRRSLAGTDTSRAIAKQIIRLRCEAALAEVAEIKAIIGRLPTAAPVTSAERAAFSDAIERFIARLPTRSEAHH